KLGTGVTCPIGRVHPAVLAQAAATAASMMPGRFFFGVGTGENLNEHILGQRWPSVGERQDMLEEAVEVMRLPWAGGNHSDRGRPGRAPPRAAAPPPLRAGRRAGDAGDAGPEAGPRT